MDYNIKQEFSKAFKVEDECSIGSDMSNGDCDFVHMVADQEEPFSASDDHGKTENENPGNLYLEFFKNSSESEDDNEEPRRLLIQEVTIRDSTCSLYSETEDQLSSSPKPTILKKFSLKKSPGKPSTSKQNTQDKLVLTEEEKGHFRANNVPIPKKLPLTKLQDKFLKSIRRKIKNKLSAQESRRKKKEYIVSLEMQVRNLQSENIVCRERLKEVETENRKILKQLFELKEIIKESGAYKHLKFEE